MKQTLILSLIFFIVPSLYAQDTLSIKVDSTFIVNDSLLIHKSDSTFTDTTTADSLSELTTAKVDTLTPLYQEPLSVNSAFITRSEIQKTDYRYTENLFKLYPLSSLNEHGLLGYPDELYLYGVSNYGTSFFKDGIFDNNRLTWFMDLNTVQAENIDSIEIIPSPRAFLYGPYNRAAAVNFISKDEISIVPYTRIKYYEGPYGEAMIDGIFNSMIFKKLVLNLDVTNRKKDLSYQNTDFSNWHISSKLKYIFSNSLNLTGSYEHLNSDVGFNGGVDIDSITSFTTDVNRYLYPISAPIKYTSRRYYNNQNNFKLRLFGKLLNNFNTDANVYHKINQTEIIDPSINYTLYKNEVNGASLKQKLLVSFAELKLNGDYEYSKLHYINSDTTASTDYFYKFNNFSASGIISAYFADSLLTPSFFYKISGETEINSGSSTSSNGSGFDLSFNLYDNFKLYFGYSIYETNRTTGNSANTEAGAELNIESLLLKFNLFSRKDVAVANRVPFQPDYNFGSISGAGLQLNYTLWNFSLQTQSSFYYNKENKYYLFPKYQFTGGLYYINRLFNDNLDLKTGFTYYYFGKKDAVPTAGFPGVSAANRIDFMLAGEIQKSAIVYFTFENILDSKYYLAPYYPTLERSIRFGLSWEIFN